MKRNTKQIQTTGKIFLGLRLSLHLAPDAHLHTHSAPCLERSIESSRRLGLGSTHRSLVTQAWGSCAMRWPVTTKFHETHYLEKAPAYLLVERLDNLTLQILTEPWSSLTGRRRRRAPTWPWTTSSTRTGAARASCAASWPPAGPTGTGTSTRWPAAVTVDRVLHCEVRSIISLGKEIHSPFRHGHQQIFLMKVELFWYSEMKIRSFQHSTVWTWECVSVRTFLSFKNTKIIQLSWEISAGAHV